MLGEKIILKDSSNGDSRTCKKNVNGTEISDAIALHKQDVDNVMNCFANELKRRGEEHDITKITGFIDYSTLVMDGVKDEEFLKSEWWIKHITQERHHVTDYCPLDVNLFDILEMIADRVTAEKGRTGSINTNYLNIDKDILLRAYWNTVRLLDEHTEREE